MRNDEVMFEDASASNPASKGERVSPSYELLYFFSQLCELIAPSEENGRQVTTEWSSVTKVAKAMGLSQGYVSGRLNLLESRFGPKLDSLVQGGSKLVDTENGVRLTSLGHELRAVVQKAIAAHAAVQEWPVSSKDSRRNELVVATSSLSLTYFLPKVAERFYDKSRSGAVDCDLRFIDYSNRDEMLQQLRSGKARIAIHEYGEHPGFLCERLDVTYDIFVVTPENIKLKPQVASEDFTRLDGLDSWVVCLIAADRDDYLPDISRHARGVIVVTQYGSVVPMIRSGAAHVGLVSTLPRNFKSNSPDPLKGLGVSRLVKNKEAQDITWQSGLWSRSDIDLNWAPAKRFRECLLEQTRESPDRKSKRSK